MNETIVHSLNIHTVHCRLLQCVQSKQDGLLQRLDELDRDNDSLRSQVAELEDARDQLQQQLNQLTHDKDQLAQQINDHEAWAVLSW